MQKKERKKEMKKGKTGKRKRLVWSALPLQKVQSESRKFTARAPVSAHSHACSTHRVTGLFSPSRGPNDCSSSFHCCFFSWRHSLRLPQTSVCSSHFLHLFSTPHSVFPAPYPIIPWCRLCFFAALLFATVPAPLVLPSHLLSTPSPFPSFYSPQ